MIKYSSLCVKGIDFVYNDGTNVTTGFNDYTNVAIVSLNDNNRLYALNSYRGTICDVIQFQTINTITQVITTINTGNYLGRQPNYFVNAQTLSEITSFEGTYYNLWTTGCLEDFSLTYNSISSKR